MRGLIGIAMTAMLSTAAGSTETAARIPLREGLTVVTAIHEQAADYESIKRITAVTPTDVTLAYSVDRPEERGGPGRGTRLILQTDLKDAHEYRQMFGVNRQTEKYAGTTAIGTSAAVLGELKVAGQTSFTCLAGGLEGTIGSMASELVAMIGGLKEPLVGEEAKGFAGKGKASGTLRRVKMASVPVIVNDRRVDLPAVVAAGKLGESDVELYFLDDATNPLTLRFTIDETTLQTVRISFPPSEGEAGGGTARRIEQAIENTGRAEIYGIYFDFDSDVLKPESDAVIREIASVMQQHPDWKLRVEGHTDKLGADAYNVELSKRRAAAVTSAIVKGFKVAAGRLSPAGFGSSQPKESNATLEGRARNRRVELVKM